MRSYFNISSYNFLVNSILESFWKLIQCCFHTGVLVNLEGSNTKTLRALPPTPITLTTVLLTLYSPFKFLLFLICSITFIFKTSTYRIIDYVKPLEVKRHTK